MEAQGLCRRGGRCANREKNQDRAGGLKKTIPQIWHIEVGINVINDPSAYYVVLNSVYKNKNDLEIYKKHPHHRAVANFFGKIIDNRVVVDHETD